jgi:hypothetical protein
MRRSAGENLFPRSSITPFRSGIRRFSGTPHGDRLDAVLVIGDNSNIDWRRTG